MKSNRACTLLTLNCGSSSLKYRVIRMPANVTVMAGEAERVGIMSTVPSQIVHTVGNETVTIKQDMPDHVSAFRAVVKVCQEYVPNDEPFAVDCFAHRYVHPGTAFKKTALVNASVLATLRGTLGYAPLHNPICFSLIELCFNEFPDKQHLVVFDTSFHATIPDRYARYALPAEMMFQQEYRRVGFHGISHEYVMHAACRYLERPPATQRIISCHLGSGGASVCAIEYGKSINSSMGFTPLEGLLMNTRSGDIDIGLLFQVMVSNNFSADSAEDMLNKRSGVLGVHKASSDLRDVLKSSADQQNSVFKMYVKRVRKYIGYYAMLLKKADVLIFTDTLGVQLPIVRQEICRHMDVFGMRLDTTKNEAYTRGIGEIQCDDSETTMLVVPTDEESMIACAAYRRMGYDCDC